MEKMVLGKRGNPVRGYMEQKWERQKIKCREGEVVPQEKGVHL